MTPMYYRSAEIIILVFDVTRLESFQSLESWIKNIKTNAKNNSLIVLVGNKIDMKERVVQRE